MTDRLAKKALTLTIVFGALLGLLWGWLRYDAHLADLRAWNLGGLGVILTVSAYAGVYALVGVARNRRDAR